MPILPAAERMLMAQRSLSYAVNMKDFHWFPLHLIFRWWKLKLRSTYINRIVFPKRQWPSQWSAKHRWRCLVAAHLVEQCYEPIGQCCLGTGGGETHIKSSENTSYLLAFSEPLWKTIGTSFVRIPSSSVNHLHDLQYCFHSCLYDILHVCKYNDKYNDPYIYNKDTHTNVHGQVKLQWTTTWNHKVISGGFHIS